MTVSELYNYFDARIPADLSEEWDNDGLMCMPTDKSVKRALIALDITKNAVRKAIDGGFDIIISHHPLIFRPLEGITDEKIISLIKNDISAFSFHTRLDSVSGGVNDVLAGLLGLQNVKPFCVMGRYGALPKIAVFQDFAKDIKTLLGAEKLSYVQNTDTVSSVALLGGDGKDFWREAGGLADVYVTGNMSYNTMLDADEAGMSVIEAGHFFTEFPVCRRISELVLQADSSIYCEILRDCPIADI